MIKKATKRLSLLLGVLLLLFTVLLPIEASAKAWPVFDGSEGGFTSLKLGESQNECVRSKEFMVNDFAIYENSRVTFNIEIDNLKNVQFALGEADVADAECLVTKEDFTCGEGSISNWSKCTCTINLKAGSYYFYVLNNSNTFVNYQIVVNAEKLPTLAQTSITEITNTKQRTMTVTYKPVKKRLGYQIEYATNSKFKNKTRVNTGATTKNIGKLTKGNIYYVRVRSYARYDDGTLYYSKWSATKKIKIKK